jgi:hypothetical protein
LQTLQQSLGSVGTAPGLNQDIELNAILIDGAPEIVLHVLDPNEHLVQMSLISRSWPAAAQAIGETRAEFLTPASHGFIRNDDAALGQDQLPIPRDEAEHEVKPDGGG